MTGRLPQVSVNDQNAIAPPPRPGKGQFTRLTMPAPIENRVDWNLVRYANCWEDAAILRTALAPAPGRRILSIASGETCVSLPPPRISGVT